MEDNKTINLENDPIFLNVEPYDDSVGYEYTADDEVPVETKTKANVVRDEILELVIQEKLDATDIKIIAAWERSPMPTEKEIALQIGISQQAVNKRVVKIRRLIPDVFA